VKKEINHPPDTNCSKIKPNSLLCTISAYLRRFHDVLLFDSKVRIMAMQYGINASGELFESKKRDKDGERKE
jgi:hypothetical protein